MGKVDYIVGFCGACKYSKYDCIQKESSCKNKNSDYFEKVVEYQDTCSRFDLRTRDKTKKG